MRKIILYLMLTTIYLSTHNLSMAMCPPGWTSASFPFTYVYPNPYPPPAELTCMGVVHYCYQFTPLNPFQVVIDYIDMDPDCADEFELDNRFWDTVYKKVAIHFGLTNVPYILPCPVPVNNFNIYRVHCWKYVNYPSQGISRLYQCGISGRCEIYGKLCYQDGFPVWILERIVSIPGDDCQLGEIPIPPLGETMETEWETDCFMIPCN